jgi:DNA polymerase-1
MADGGGTANGMAKRQVFVVDGSSFMFRAFHQAENQDPRYNARSDGQSIGAVRLFAAKMYQFLRQGAAGVMPSHLVVVFDKGTDKSWRRKEFPAYKGTRAPMKDDLKRQVGLVREVVSALGLAFVESDGVEGDDLMAAYAKAAREQGHEVLLATSDKDMMQLVRPGVLFYDAESGRPGKPGYRPERLLDEAGIAEKWLGMPPARVGDMLALIGDTSDNIPGIKGIGDKTAAELLTQFGDLETLLARASEIKQTRRRELVIAGTEDARLSRRLVTLQEDVALPVALDDLAVDRFEPNRYLRFLKAMELGRLVASVAKEHGIDPASVSAADEHAAVVSADDPEAEILAAVRLPYAPEGYETVRTRAALDALVSELMAEGFVGLHVEGGRDGIVGIGLAAARVAYIPIGHRTQGDLLGGLFGDPEADGQMLQNQALAGLRPLLESREVRKVTHDAKAVHRTLARYGARMEAVEDAMLVSYALDCGLGGHGIEEVCARHLMPVPKSPADILGGKGKPTLADLPPAQGALRGGCLADAIVRIWLLLEPRLRDRGVLPVYRDIDLPTCRAVAGMEANGVLVDRKVLSGLSREFGETMSGLEAELHALAGEKVDVGSPKKVGDIMFVKLGLPGGKRTPSGQWATPGNLLDDLALKGHAFPGKLVEHRRVSKLKSTYADALPLAIDPLDGRVHTTFQLAHTGTGRLSSVDPNLQNIPIRTEDGRRIRRAFVAARGNRIVSADYSQIELRLLAHIADIPQLKQAFADGIDIHTATASAMFGVPVADVPGEMRRRAKTINFGIIYGISAFGLAERLGIPQGEASAFIKDYFERFPGIRDYIEGTKAKAREDGFVRTLYGRVMHFPGIRTNNAAERAGIERAAINAPIQGTAADVVRRAMVRVEAAVRAEADTLGARLLLQVHDEFVFEVPEDGVERTIAIATREMEAAPGDDVGLTVPLTVSASAAGNWEEAH